MNSKSAAGTAIFVFLLVFGVSIHAQTYDFRQGWCEGVVVRLGTSEQIGTRKFSDCRKFATPEQLATGRFVVLAYKHFGRPHLHVAFTKEDQTLQPGDRLYVNVSKCDVPMVFQSRPSVNEAPENAGVGIGSPAENALQN